VDLADFVGKTGVKENTLGRRRFTGIDVGRDTDVSYTFNGGFSCHLVSFVVGKIWGIIANCSLKCAKRGNPARL
jgi:hypothetical protein